MKLEIKELKEIMSKISLAVEKSKINPKSSGIEIETVDGITLINPGCMTLYSTVKSFAYVVLSGEKVTAVINDKLLN